MIEFDQEILEEMMSFITVIGIGDAGCMAVEHLKANHISGVHLINMNTKDGLNRLGIKGIEIPANDNDQSKNMGYPSAHSTVSGNTALKISADTEKKSDLVGLIKLAIQTQLAEKQSTLFVNPIEEADMLVFLSDLSEPVVRQTMPIITTMEGVGKSLSISIVTMSTSSSYELEEVKPIVQSLKRNLDTVIRIPFLPDWSDDSDTVLAPLIPNKNVPEFMALTVQSFTDLIKLQGLICVDYVDVKRIFNRTGICAMGYGVGSGPDRAFTASYAALASSTLLGVKLTKANSILINITGDYYMTLMEVDQAVTAIRERMSPDSDIVFGAILDESIVSEIKVTIVVAGIGRKSKTALEGSK